MALRRACTLMSTATLAAGLLTALAITPAAATPTAVEVGKVADQLVDKDGTTLWLAGSDGVDYGTAATGRTKVVDIDSAGSLAQAADGTVYASSEHTLYRIATDHTATTIATGEYDCLGDVAVTAGTVWVVSSCDSTGTTDPRVVKIADGDVTADVITPDQPGSMRLASSAGAPDELVVSDHSMVTYTDEDGEHQFLAPRFRAFDMGGATPSEISRHGFSGEGSMPSLELNRDGSRLLAGANDYFLTFDVSSPDKYQEYWRSGWDVSAAAFSADGRVVALAHRNGATNQVDVYSADGTWLRTSTVTNPVVGLAWQGSALLTVDRPNTGGDRAQVQTSAYRTTPQIESYTQYESVYWDQQVVGGGRVRTEAGDPVRAMRLTLTRTGPGGTKDLGTIVTGDDGTFSWKNTPGLAGRFTYTVKTPIDDVFVQKSGSATYAVSHHTPALKITTDHSRYNVGQRAVITATLGRSYSNKFVSFYGKGYGEPSVLLRKSRVDSHGRLSVVVYMPFTATFTAKFYGDSRYSAATASVTRTAKARIDTGLSKPIRKSHGYAVYKAKKGSVFYAAVRPAHKGSSVHFVLQRYTHGHWRNYLYGNVKQTKDGVAGIRYAGKAGVKYRERASVATSPRAIGNTSAWRYVTFTN